MSSVGAWTFHDPPLSSKDQRGSAGHVSIRKSPFGAYTTSGPLFGYITLGAFPPAPDATMQGRTPTKANHTRGKRLRTLLGEEGSRQRPHDEVVAGSGVIFTDLVKR